MIKMRYRHTVVKQGFHQGLSLFKEHAIGVPRERVSFAIDEATALANLRGWQLDAFHDYHLIGLERVSDSEVPWGAWVFSGYQQGYRHDTRSNFLTRCMQGCDAKARYA